MSGKLSTAVFVALACLVAPVRGQDAPKESATFTLTKIAKKALDDQFKKDWALADVSPSAAPCAPEENATSYAEGDFNSDGQLDVAAMIKTGGAVRLVAILNRKEDATIVDLDAVDRSAPDGYVTVRHRGERFRNPDDSLDDYFTADTIVLVRCGQPATAYFWSGASFRKVSLAKG